MNFYEMEESVREEFLERELLFASADVAVNAEAAAAGQMKSSCGSPGCNDDCPWMYVGVDRVLPEDHECADPDAERRWLQFRCWYWHGRKPKGDNPRRLEAIDFAEHNKEGACRAGHKAKTGGTRQTCLFCLCCLHRVGAAV